MPCGASPRCLTLAFFLPSFGFDADLIVLVLITEANFADPDLVADVRLTFRAGATPASTFSLLVGVEVCLIAFFSKFPK